MSSSLRMALTVGDSPVKPSHGKKKLPAFLPARWAFMELQLKKQRKEGIKGKKGDTALLVGSLEGSPPFFLIF